MKHMKQGSTLFLKVALLLIGIAVLAALLGLPWLDGHNAGADFNKVYFQDPLLTYIYIAMLPVFVAIYWAYQLVIHIEHNNVFSTPAVRALRNIKYCAYTVAGLLSLAIAYIYAVGERDNPGVFVIFAGGVFMIIAVAVAAGEFQRMLEVAVDIKSEHDLTV